MKKITKEMTINEIIAVDGEDKGIVEILLEAGMHCVGCPSARSESLEHAGFVHNEDADALLNKINDYLASK